jgi:hypothetical protein
MYFYWKDIINWLQQNKFQLSTMYIQKYNKMIINNGKKGNVIWFNNEQLLQCHIFCSLAEKIDY